MGQGMAHRIDRLHPWRGMYFFVRELPVFDFFASVFLSKQTKSRHIL